MDNEVLEILKNYSNLENFGYFILFLYSMGGGYIAILSAAVLSSINKLDLTLSITIAISGNIIGSSLFALFARIQQKDIKKMMIKHKRKIAYTQIMIKRYDWILFIVSKYLHGIRTFVPIAVGISRYNIKKFFLINAIGAIIWGISLGFLGFYASGFFIDIIRVLLEYPYLLPVVFIGIVIIVVLFMYIKKRLSKANIL